MQQRGIFPFLLQPNANTDTWMLLSANGCLLLVLVISPETYRFIIARYSVVYCYFPLIQAFHVYMVQRMGRVRRRIVHYLWISRGITAFP